MHLENFTEGWSPVHVGLEGAALSIGGINPWLHVHGWKRVQQDCIVVPHPAYRQERHRAWVYEVTSNGKTTRFAASELSNGVWGFYVPCNDAAQPVAQADLRQLRWLVRLAPTLGHYAHTMKTRTVIVLAVVVVAAMIVEWKFAASMGAAQAKHGYHGICNGGVGNPYADFIRELRKMAESGDTNQLATVLRRADERSRDIYDVWLYDDRDAYRKSLDEILR
jgi:hypothetical protein